MEKLGPSVADTTALWARSILPQLQTIEAEIHGAAGSAEGSIEFTLELDFLPQLLQFALSAKVIRDDHVALLSIQRLLLGAIGDIDKAPAATWKNLRDFNATNQNLYGRSCTSMNCGRAGDSSYTSPFKYCQMRNSGGFSVKSLQRENPPAISDPGPQMDNYLNALEAAKRNDSWSYMSSDNRRLTLVRLSSDGFLIKAGLETDELHMVNVGLVDHTVAVEEAQKINDMTDEELAAYAEKHPLASEVVEFMLVTTDGKSASNLGFDIKTPKGGASEVKSMVFKYIDCCRPCHCCLLAAFESATSTWDHAFELCDFTCSGCRASQKAMGNIGRTACKRHPGRNIRTHRCTRCERRNLMCCSIEVDSTHLDNCGSNSTFMNDEYLNGGISSWPDGVHLDKSGVLGATNYYICCPSGSWASMRQLLAIYYDANKLRRDQVRGVVTLDAIIATNRFSIEDRVAVTAPHVQEACLLPAEKRSTRPVWVLSTLSPSVRSFWAQNLASCLLNPAGITYDPVSNLIIYVDNGSGSLRLLRWNHTKGFNTVLSQFKDTANIMDVTIIKGRAFVTDMSSAIWVIDISKNLTPKRSANDGKLVDEGANDDDRVPSSSIAAGKRRLLITAEAGAGTLGSPFGIASDSRRSTLYVTDTTNRALGALLLSPLVFEKAHYQLMYTWPCGRTPRGVAVLCDGRVVVAVDNEIVLLTWRSPLSDSSPSMCAMVIFTGTPGVVFCGVAAHQSALRIAVFANVSLHAVALLTLNSEGTAWEYDHIAGGNFQRREEGLQEGTAANCTIFRPFSGVFVGENIAFTHSGYTCIQLLGDLKPLVYEVMPALQGLAEAWGLSESSDLNARDLSQMHAKLSVAAYFFDAVQAINLARCGRRGGQGADGNFSNSFSRAIKNTLGSIERLLQSYVHRQVPARVVALMVPQSSLTIKLEFFFGTQRRAANDGNPTVYQYGLTRSRSIKEGVKSNAVTTFSYYTGPSKHYDKEVMTEWVQTVHQSKRPPRSILSAEERASKLRILRASAKRLRGRRTQMVTDRGKGQAGALPLGLKASRLPMSTPASGLFHIPGGRTKPCEIVQLGVSRILFSANSLLLVKAARGSPVPFFFVLLLEPLTECQIEASGKAKKRRMDDRTLWRVSTERPLVRHFSVSTEDANLFLAEQPPVESRVSYKAFYKVVSYHDGTSDLQNRLIRYSVSEEELDECADTISGDRGAANEDIESSSDGYESTSSEDDRPEQKTSIVERAGKRQATSFDIRNLLNMRSKK